MTEFTGERVIPGQVDADLWAEHVSRYRFAASIAAHLGSVPNVLDVGCGAGYGTAVLAEHAASATGIDIAADAIAYARSNYTYPGLSFLPGSATALPFSDAAFDLVAAFEVIEHLADWKVFLAEARRVMRSGAVFIVSTPNTAYYAETRAKEGPNPYHVHEFTFDEFSGALAAVFPFCTIALQNHVDAFAFYDAQTSLPVDGFLETTAGTPSTAHFFVGICSFRPLASPRNFVYVSQATNLLREREHHIALLQDELGVARAERDQTIRLLDEQIRHTEAQNRWALQLEQELKQKSADLKTVVDALDTAENTVIERTLWAQGLQGKMDLVQASRWLRLGRKLGLGPKIDDHG